MRKFNINKKVLIIISIILLIIAIIIVKNIKKNSEKVDMGEPAEVATPEDNTEIGDNIDSTIKRVSIKNNYYYIENSMNKFYSILSKNNLENNDIEQSKVYLYSLLGSEYIEENGITMDNVLNSFASNNNADYSIIDMFVSQRSFDISVYFVYGKVRENGQSSSFNCMIIADRTNNTFKIYPNGYVNRYDIREGNSIEISVPDSISNDGYNTFAFKNVSVDLHAEDLFYNLKNMLLYDNETLYERLDSEYKSNFGSYQDFYDYISSIYKDLIKIKYSGYNKLNQEDMSTIYTFKDDSGKFVFTIHETDAFYYSVKIEKVEN